MSRPPTGVSREYGPGLGVVTADFNGDGWIDLYVANDGQPNQLWINQRNGAFKDTALLAGVALSATVKRSRAWGWTPAISTTMATRTSSSPSYGKEANSDVNDGSGIFVDASARSRVRFATLPFTGFGAAWLDADNDGWLDVLAVNGAVTSIEELVRANDPFRCTSGNNSCTTSERAV